MDANCFEMFAPSVLRLAKTVQAIKSRKMAEYELKGTNALCLCQIFNNREGGLTASELAHCCDIDKAQVSRCMTELSARGLVYRNDMEGRRYKQKYRLTPQGSTVAEDIYTTARRVQKVIRKGITPDEIETFYRILDKICENCGDLLEEI